MGISQAVRPVMGGIMECTEQFLLVHQMDSPFPQQLLNMHLCGKYYKSIMFQMGLSYTTPLETHLYNIILWRDIHSYSITQDTQLYLSSSTSNSWTPTTDILHYYLCYLDQWNNKRSVSYNYNQSRYYNQCYTSHVICVYFIIPWLFFYSNMQNLDFGAFQSQSEGANVEWGNPLM
mgnify:CR=1 FL=1